MLTEPQRDHFEIVLVSPRNPLNIGAAARAMANFGFRRLTVVAPYEEHWREAKSAIGASDLLQSAKRAEHLAEAIAECTLVVGTASTRKRKQEQPLVPLPEFASFLSRQFAAGGRIALVFGSEKRGLTRNDLAHCHVLVEIPADARQPSMNLGQAVAVCLYEIAARFDESKPSDGNREKPFEAATPASTRDLELLADVVEETMRAAKYSPTAMRNANRHDLDLLLRRLIFSGRDARRMLGFFRRILWRLTRQTRC
ncbi:MAG TPA: RNA methyltransferase [Terracidiphilus sp.]